MHRAIYRSFIVSAGLVSIYSEPCLASVASNKSDIKQLSDADELSDAQKAFLDGFAPYNTVLDTKGGSCIV